jgi:TetR/AcrR family transcriptional repressor of nem operon
MTRTLDRAAPVHHAYPRMGLTDVGHEARGCCRHGPASALAGIERIEAGRLDPLDGGSGADDRQAFGSEDTFTQRLADMDEALETTDDAEAARRAWLEVYLSPGHRDSPENGCAGAALAGDVARAPDGAALRDAYVDGLKSMIEKMERLGNRPADPEAREQEVLVELATAVGAVVLSRAIAGDDLSERLLAAVRRRLIDE